MGTNESKLTTKLAENEENQEKEQESIPSTPILTPKIFKENIKKEGLDPRSPSKHIARTPIELLSAAAEKLKSLSIETTDDEVSTLTPLKTHILLGIDPRSPTLEVQRTPIVVSASPDKKLPAKLRNKNLDNVLKSTLAGTPNHKIIPPKLLESSPVTPKLKTDAYKRKSFVLLETNVDFTETDLDNVIQAKYLGKSLPNLDASEEINYTEIIDPRSPTIDFLRTPIQVCKQEDDPDTINNKLVDESSESTSEQNNSQDVHIQIPKADNNDEHSEDLTTVNSSHEEEPVLVVEDQLYSTQNDESVSIQVVQTNIAEAKPEESNDLPEEAVENEPVVETCSVELEQPINVTPCRKPTSAKETLVLSPIRKEEPQFPRSAPVTPPNIISITPKKSKSQPVSPPLINLTADVKELDKKLTHLIYEDEDLVVCPRIVKIKDQNRTPLGLRNSNENKKSTQKLKVSDKPRKAEYAVSKIPVFKEKKVKVQCENTPPRNMRGHAPKKSQWDAKDDTLVI